MLYLNFADTYACTDDQLRGFTGSLEACRDAARQYRVYYHKTEEEADGDYLGSDKAKVLPRVMSKCAEHWCMPAVDHSIIHYLVDPAGDCVSFFSNSIQQSRWQQQSLRR